jgi:hypothetical protein
MRVLGLAALAVGCIVLIGCPTDVSRTNPLDPQSDNPAPGTLRGAVEAPTRASQEGIRVRLLDGPAEPAPALTDGEGRFVFSGLVRGHYTLEIAETGFQRLLVYRVEVPQGGVLDLGALILVPLSETEDASLLRGEVNLEGLDLHGGVHVRTIGRPFDTHTAVDGSWQMMVPEGTYDLEFAHPDYQTFVQTDVSVGRGETHVLESLVLLAEPATITGTVLRRTCSPDPGDEFEVAAEDALVTALGTGQTALADESGAFSVTGLPAGVYTLRATLDGNEAVQVPGLAVRGGQILAIPEPLILTASKGAIAGRIRASGESDHSGTIVQLSGTGFGAFTASDGSFRIDGVCAGEGYQITATRHGFVTASRGGISVTAGEVAHVDELTLERQQGGFVLNGGDAFTGASDRTIPYVLTAPAGSTEMRMSEDASLFDDPARAEEGWVPYLREGTFTLTEGEGTKKVLAQVRGGGAASGILQGTVILDLTPPTDPVIVIEDGTAYSNTPDGAVLLTLTASEVPAAGVDAVSGLAWLRLLNHDLQSGGTPPSGSDDPAWDAASAVPYARTVHHPLLRPSQDEEKEVWVRFGDRAGNWSEPVSSRVVLDRQPPENLSLTIVGSAPGYANSGIVVVQLTATDENPGVTMRVANDSTFTGATWMPFSPEITWFLTPGDGPKEVWAEFRDAAGNRTQALSDEVILDTEPPTGARMSIEEAPYSPVRDVTLSLSAQGATAMVFSLEPDFTDAEGEHASWLAFGASHSIALPDADGTHTIYGKFRDDALNETVRLSAIVVLDRIAPTVAGVSIAEGAYVPAPSVTVLTTAVPGERDAHEMRVDVVDVATTTRTDGSWGPFNPSQPLTLPSPAGEKQVEVFLRDAAGNVSDPGVVVVTYDPDPPVIAAMMLAGGADYTASPEVTVDVDATGAAQMIISNRADFAGAVWQPFANSFAWPLPPADGLHTVYLRLRDLAGNEASTSATIVLDRTAPAATAVHIDGGATFSQTGIVDLVLEAVDTGSGMASVRISNDPGFGSALDIPWPAGAPSVTREDWPLAAGEGLRTVYARFFDQVGHFTDSAASIVVDTVAPTGTVRIDGGATYATALAVTLAFTADSDVTGIAVANEMLDCATTTYQAFTSTLAWSLAEGADGPRTVWACFRDAAGHTASASAGILLDTTPPEGTLLIDDGAEYATATTVTLQVSASPDVEAMAVANGGLDCATASYMTFVPVMTWSLGTGNGTKTVTVCLRDAAGLLGSTSASIVLDTVLPIGTLELAGGAAYTTTVEVEAALTFPDDTYGWAVGDAGLSCDTAAYTQVAAGTVSATPTHTLPGGDGPKTVVACFKDLAGNTASASDNIILDTTPPTGTVSIDRGAAYATTTEVTLHLSAPSDTVRVATANAETIDCESPPEPYEVYTATKVWTLTAGDGVKTVSVCFEDAAGNTASASDTIVLDTTDPEGTIEIDGGAEYATRTQVTLTLAAPADTIAMAIANGGSLACDSTAYEGFSPQRTWLLPSGDGTKEVTVCFKDAAGNTASATDSIVLDTQPPVGTITLAGGATYSQTPTVSVSLQHPDDTNGYALANAALDCAGATYVAITVGTTSTSTSWTLPGGDGTKTVAVCFRDLAGNTASAAATIVLDETPPSGAGITLAPAPFADTRNVTATLEVSGAHEMCLWGDIVGGSTDDCADVGWEALLHTRALTLTDGDGPKTVRVVYRDPAGWTTTPAEATVLLDRTPPDVTFASVTLIGRDRNGESTTLTRLPNVTVGLAGFPDADTASPDPSGLPEMRVSENAAFSGATWQPYAASFQWVLSGGDGPKSLYVQVRDGAGNESDAVTGTIDLDQTPPRPGSVILDDGATYATSPSVTLTLWVGGDAVEWSLDGGQSWMDCATPTCATASPGESHPHTLPPGDGLKRVQVVFRDEAGNVSETFSDDIFLDTTPPDLTDASLSLVSPTENGFANSVSVNVRLAYPADATHMRVGPAASPSGCVESDMDGVTVQPVAGTFTFLLPAGDGTKRVCARLLDAAGNESGFLSDTIVLDTVPPTTPLIVTPSQVVSMPNGSDFVVNTAAPVSDTNFWRYEILGGQIGSWTPASEFIGTTAFTFQLFSNPSIDAGVPNLLRLRAVDRAGNVSPEASVIITVDERPPAPVALNRLWVRNASGKATIYWEPSPSPDVVGYRIYYGTAPGDYSGLHATEGASPVLVGNQTSAVLSGLTNGAATYVTVRPVDHAGLEGPSPWWTSEVVLWPNEVPLNLIQETSLGFSHVTHIARYGTYLYAIGTSGSCTANAPMYLRAVDISRLVSPVHGGAIQANPPGPEVVWSNEYADDLDCESVLFGTALIIDGHWMFTISGSRLRIFDLSVPSSPTVHATLDFGPTILGALSVRGRTAFLAGRGTTIALDLTKLYDGDPNTVPSTADEIGRALGHNWPSGITWTRDRLAVTGWNDGALHSYDISNVLAATPAFDNASWMGWRGGGNAFGNHPASGTYGFFTDRFSMRVMDLTSLWAGTPLNPSTDTIASIGQGASCPMSIAGGQAFGADEANRGIRGYEVTNLPNIEPVSFYGMQTNAVGMSTMVWGNYLFTADYSSPWLRVYEIATPRVMSPATSISGVSHLHQIEGAFLYSSDGAVVDLQAGSPPPIIGPEPNQTHWCSREVTVFEETSVAVHATHLENDYLRVYRNEKVTDRNAATSPTTGTDIYSVTFPEGTVPTGVARHGNYLVVAQAREDGIWLEVFDATPLRDGRSDTVLDDSWSVGEFRVSEHTSDDPWAMVTMHHGRALVSYDAGFDGATYAGLIIVDLRPLLDGDSSTSMTPDHIQGAIDISRMRGVVAIGNYAYAIGGSSFWTGGLYVIDISAALDDDLATKVPSSASPVLTGPGPFDSITAHGSYLLLGSRSNNFGLRSYDISNPTSPVLVGQAAFGYLAPRCGNAVTFRSQISVLGSRAYVTSNDSLTIFELE